MTSQGFNSIQGMSMTLTGDFCVAASGHYMCINPTTDQATTPKTAFPATLTDELCGANECVGGLRLGDAGAPTTATSDASTMPGGTMPPAPAPAPGFVAQPTPKPPPPSGVKATTSDANGLIPSAILLSIAFLLSF